MIKLDVTVAQEVHSMALSCNYTEIRWTNLVDNGFRKVNAASKFDSYVAELIDMVIVVGTQRKNRITLCLIKET